MLAANDQKPKAEDFSGVANSATEITYQSSLTAGSDGGSRSLAERAPLSTSGMSFGFGPELGDITAVPEPEMYGLICAVGLGLVVVGREVRRNRRRLRFQLIRAAFWIISVR